MALRTTWLMLACLAFLCTTAVCADPVRIYTTGPSDGGFYYAQAHDDYPEVRWAGYSSSSMQIRFGDYAWIEYGTGVFQFPIGNLAGTTLAPGSAKLRVYCQAGSTWYTSPLKLSGFCFDGGGTISWSLYSGSRAFVDFVPYQGSAWLEIDVTADLQRQIDAGYSWAGYYCSLDHLEGQYVFPGEIYANLSTFEDAVHRPYLEIVPEPSSLMALMAGISSLGVILSRHRKQA